MNQLSRIFSQATAQAANYAANTEAKKQDEKDKDGLLEAYLPTDSVSLQSSSQSFSSNNSFFAPMRSSGGFSGGLPSLSKSYNSDTGSLFDLKG